MLPKVICGIRSPILEALRGALTIHNLSHPLWVSTCTSRGGSAVGTGDGRMGGVCVHTRVCVGWGCRGHSLISSAHPCHGSLAPSLLPTLHGCGSGELETWKSQLPTPSHIFRNSNHIPHLPKGDAFHLQGKDPRASPDSPSTAVQTVPRTPPGGASHMHPP